MGASGASKLELAAAGSSHGWLPLRRFPGFDLPRRRVLAVREDLRSRPPTDPKAAIVALPLDPGGAETILVEGADFLSSPRLAPGGERLCWIAWDHPGMPWDGTELL